MWRAFSQAVVFLYLLDEETSLLILVPTGIGTVIEVRETLWTVPACTCPACQWFYK